jgi:hypothetical protein
MVDEARSQINGAGVMLACEGKVASSQYSFAKGLLAFTLRF